MRARQWTKPFTAISFDYHNHPIFFFLGSTIVFNEYRSVCSQQLSDFSKATQPRFESRQSGSRTHTLDCFTILSPDERRC